MAFRCCCAQVPARLQQLSQLMGGADLQGVLALTRRCPMVLGVEAALMAPRLEALCKLLQRPLETEVRCVLCGWYCTGRDVAATVIAKCVLRGCSKSIWLWSRLHALTSGASKLF
jgi:hypothetical protein